MGSRIHEHRNNKILEEFTLSLISQGFPTLIDTLDVSPDSSCIYLEGISSK